MNNATCKHCDGRMYRGRFVHRFTCTFNNQKMSAMLTLKMKPIEVDADKVSKATALLMERGWTAPMVRAFARKSLIRHYAESFPVA